MTCGTNLELTRVFIVGCARSGTTLLQRLLARHPDVITFPESHFFDKTVSKGIRGRFNRPLPGAAENLRRFLDTAGLEIGNTLRFPSRFRSARFWTGWFIERLDETAVSRGKSIWIEKTPLHLHFIDDIVTAVPEARFIHIIRNGMENAASLYRVTREYRDYWGGARSPETCALRWAQDVEISLRYLNKANHYLVRYERLVKDTRKVMESLGRFVGLDYSPGLWTCPEESPLDFILPEENWKERARKEICLEAAASSPFEAGKIEILDEIIEPWQKKLDDLFTEESASIDFSCEHTS